MKQRFIGALIALSIVAMLGAIDPFAPKRPIDMSNYQINNLGAPTSGTDAVNKTYSTNASNLASGTVADARLSTNVTLLGNSTTGTDSIVRATSPTLVTPSITLGGGLSADGNYTGVSETGTAGETLAFGEVVYFKAADSRWWKTDADSATTSGGVKVAICVSSGTAGGALTVMLFGKIRADSLFPTMTIGAPVFLSQTAGAITSTQPTGTDVVVRVAGFANTADELFWNPSPDYLTLN